MKNGINVSTTVDKESLNPLTDSIVRIMESRADQETIRAGLGVLTQMASVQNLMIQNCHVVGDRNITIETDNEVVRDT